ncbi:hypothetical protein BGZ98_003211 [Dissophora globulifera]|nr:hypothetical protein BGZ98_003211 [Dissophora globulifera]
MPLPSTTSWRVAFSLAGPDSTSPGKRRTTKDQRARSIAQGGHPSDPAHGATASAATVAGRNCFRTGAFVQLSGGLGADNDISSISYADAGIRARGATACTLRTANTIVTVRTFAESRPIKGPLPTSTTHFPASKAYFSASKANFSTSKTLVTTSTAPTSFIANTCCDSPYDYGDSGGTLCPYPRETALSATKVSSPTLSPTSPTRRGKPQIPAGLQYKKLDIQDLIPNRDQSLQAQSEILHRQGQGEGQDAQREQTEEKQGEHKQRLQQTGDEQESAATSESTQDADNGSAVEETENNKGAADSSGAILEELSQEWLPSLLSKSFATSKIFLDNLAVPQDPIPRERVFLKGWYHPSQTDEPGFPQNLNIIVNSSTSVPEEDEQNSETTKVSSPVQHSPSSVTANALRQQPLASSSSTSLASSLSSSSSTKTRVSLSMPIFIPGASSGAGGENKNRNSGSAQNRRSQELSSPVDNQRNPYNNNGKGRPSTSQINNSGGYSTSRDVTLQDIIAQDPFSGMKPPLPDPNIEPAPADPFLRCFWFMHLLEQTMTTGGFLSPKLYVPKMIWYQKAMIRLPAIDAKIYTCQTISQVLERLTAQSKSGQLSLLVKMDKDVEKAERERSRVLNELEALETMTVEHWTRLAKKMSFINRPGKLSGTGGGGVGWAGSGSGSQLYHQGQSSRPPHHYEYQNPHFQPQQRMLQLYQEESALGPYDWIGSDDPFSSLATASLQSATMSSGALSSGALSTGQMTSSNLTSSSLSEKAGAGGAGNKRTTTEIKNQWKSFSKSVQKTMVNEKIEDTTEYTEALVKLFQSSFVLEDMIKHFGSLPPHQTHIKILNKLQRICDFYNMVVCAFVIRDLGELMVKYVKRMGSLVAE